MAESGYQAHNSLSDIYATIEIFKCQTHEAPVEPERVYGDSGMIKDMLFEGVVTPCFAYGKYRTIPINFIAKMDQKYLRWAASNKCDIDKDTKKFIEQYITE